MSWLKSAVSKVREQGEALKSGQTLRVLTEKTTSVVASTVNQVQKVREHVRTRHPSVIEVEAKLEERARTTRVPAQLAELHRSWVQQLAPKDVEKQSPASAIKAGEREMSFKEMLLQSRAIELTIETIASDPQLRQAYAEEPVPEDKASPAACLYELLKKTLACPEERWSEVLRATLTADGLNEGHVVWLTTVFSAMKLDWQEEALYAERKDLALRAEYLRQEIKQLEAHDDSSGETADDRHRRRVSASTELLQTYKAVRRNLDEAQTQRRDSAAARESELALVAEQIQAHIVGLQSSAQSSSEKHRHLEGELKQSGESIQLQLRHMDEVRAEIDKELETLEERKRALRIELDEVSRSLDEARLRQRQHMEKCDKERTNFSTQKVGLKTQIDTAEEAAQAAEREQALVERTRQLVRDTESLVQQTLGKQAEDLKKKQTEFDGHFRELLQKHLGFAEEQLKHLRTRAEAASLDQERVEVAKAAEAAQEAFRSFRGAFAEVIAGTEAEATVQKLEAEHTSLLELLGPTAASPATQPPPPPLAVGARPSSASSTAEGDMTPADGSIVSL